MANGLIREFREFIARGNVMDLAVGVIIGSAFGKIVTSLVNDIVMPPIGLLLKGINFKDLFLNLGTGMFEKLDDARKASAPVIAYGAFLNALLEFLIIAACVFAIVKTLNRIQERAAAAAAARAEAEVAPEPNTRDCPYCVSAIPIKASRCAHCTSELSVA